MNPLGLVAIPNPQENIRTAQAWRVFPMILVGVSVCLVGCQHIQWAGNPLPITLTPTNDTPTKPLPYCHELPKPKNHHRTPCLMSPPPNDKPTPFFILENWF